MVLEANSSKELATDSAGLMPVMAEDTSATSPLNDDVDELLEGLVLWAYDRFGQAEIIRARDEFFWKTGKVFHDDACYKDRMGYFFDFFLFERPLPDGVRTDDQWATPFATFQIEKGLGGATPFDTCPVVNFRHGIFEVLKTSEDQLFLRDMFRNAKVTVVARPSQSFKLMAKKQIFQGFLYQTQDNNWVLSQGIIFHPASAWKLLLKSMKALSNRQDSHEGEALARFARLELRHARHSHIDARRTYAQEIG